MKYRRNWDGQTEITVGNTVKTAERQREAVRGQKVIQMENIRPRRENDRGIHRRRARRRRRRAMTYRLALQCLTMTLLLIMIAMLDGATLIQSAVLMMGIISCSAVMLLLDLDERKER